MSQSTLVRRMKSEDITLIHEGLAPHDVSKPVAYIEQCWEENERENRLTLLAFHENEFAGWGHIVYNSHYPYFAENDIPEIQNLDVIPPLRKCGIGSVLMEALETEVFTSFDTIGIGFGLYASYGTAQRLYTKRGYIPDGRGLMYDNLPAVPGSQVRVDDELTLYLTKSR
ncbi:GNAT family N-acetyltransferase [Paenibacillus sp. FSL P4-0338]|uniref:GNAT family N-acetyltransferase n=1 Tax=unclassified Paenibacillus TaxID=185978 RepID=UPI0003E1E129|nr:GNAT family N-acetyltransferase [Paenibacillus sp. FSL R7-269]ETT51939.1 N-acetyltransferase GCN5 [Paenibacillus sp. FSL R7-269]